MSRDSNIEIFEDTIRIIMNSDELLQETGEAIRNQKMIAEVRPLQDRPELNGRERNMTDKTVIRVSSDRSFEAAVRAGGKHTAVLNFASWHVPGGGVERGANAQEESLCRISTLYPCLADERMNESFYAPHMKIRNPIYSDELIYTPGVTVIKTDTDNPVLLPPEKWFRTDVISMAAPNISALYRPADTDLDGLYRRRIGKILGTAYDHGADTVVLGAFGCGVFGNDPERMAEAMADVIKKTLHLFKRIEIPVFCPPFAPILNNLSVFAKVFSSAFGKNVLSPEAEKFLVRAYGRTV